MIGSCNCPITANCPITLSYYNFADQLELNTAIYEPITFEEIVVVMIKKIYHKILKSVLPHFQISFKILRRELCLILFPMFGNANSNVYSFF